MATFRVGNRAAAEKLAGKLTFPVRIIPLGTIRSGSVASLPEELGEKTMEALKNSPIQQVEIKEGSR